MGYNDTAFLPALFEGFVGVLMFLAVDEIDVNNLTVSDIQDDHEVIHPEAVLNLNDGNARFFKSSIDRNNVA